MYIFTAPVNKVEVNGRRKTESFSQNVKNDFDEVYLKSKHFEMF